ncbi:transposase [Pyxidicoccus trucidator]|uniref:transposase n=1 Tax=Pyxidicoccus trucidator TaxID=2709662 RepID=UPI001F07F337|nr:transposase [Pyxidicoccus trucidator]
MRAPPRSRPRCAQLEGFSLHANTHLHANDREGLERLCRYGARGALALERLTRLEDGRLSYRTKLPLPDGTSDLVLPVDAFLRRLAALVPPPGSNLVRFHGLFAPGAALRPRGYPSPRRQRQFQRRPLLALRRCGGSSALRGWTGRHC